MRLDRSARLLTASLTLGLVGAATIGARDERGRGDSEYGIGLYLGNCESLVAGAALFDLGDAELKSEEFGEADATPTLEEELERESDGDETAVEEAIGEAVGGLDPSDREVVVQDDTFLVWVNTGAPFDADLAGLVEAPFAVAVREDAQDGADPGGEDGGDFLACGTFGGVVAGDEIVIPLRPLNGSGLGGISILRQNESESVSSLYLYREETAATPVARSTPVAEGALATEGTPPLGGTPVAEGIPAVVETPPSSRVPPPPRPSSSGTRATERRAPPDPSRVWQGSGVTREHLRRLPRGVEGSEQPPAVEPKVPTPSRAPAATRFGWAEAPARGEDRDDRSSVPRAGRG